MTSGTAVGASPETTAGGKELEALLHDGLSRLPAASREVLVLRDVEGLTTLEVAKVLGISVQAVISRLHPARAALQSAVAPRLGEVLGQERRADCPDILAMYSKELEGELTSASVRGSSPTSPAALIARMHVA